MAAASLLAMNLFYPAVSRVAGPLTGLIMIAFTFWVVFMASSVVRAMG